MTELESMLLESLSGLDQQYREREQAWQDREGALLERLEVLTSQVANLSTQLNINTRFFETLQRR